MLSAACVAAMWFAIGNLFQIAMRDGMTGTIGFLNAIVLVMAITGTVLAWRTR